MTEAELLHQPGGGFKSIIEPFTEGIGKGFFKEFIDPDAVAAPLLEGTAADVPPVKVEGAGAVAEGRYPYGIETAGNGLYETALARRMGPLHGAEAIVPLEAGVGALLASAKQRSHHIAVGVDLEETGLRNALAAFGRHIILIIVVFPFEFRCLLFLQRSAAVTYYAAGPLAYGIIATEELRHDLRGDQDVAYLDYGRPFVRHIFCKIKQ